MLERECIGISKTNISFGAEASDSIKWQILDVGIFGNDGFSLVGNPNIYLTLLILSLLFNMFNCFI